MRRDIQRLDERYRYQENKMDHFYVTLPSDSSLSYFTANTIAKFRTKLVTPLELKHDKREFGLVEISYPKGYMKRFLHNSLSLDSEEIIFPVKHYESFLIFLQIYHDFWSRL